MPAAADYLEFAPPPQPGLVRAFVLAIIAHVLLMLALTWGINWNRESENVAAEAELWASVPQQAAPREVVAPPPPPAPPVQQVAPTPPPPAVPREADIALEREKLKKEQALRKQEELERQKKLEAKKKREEMEREKKLEARKKEEAQKKQQLAEQKAAEEQLKQKQKREELAKARQDEAKLAELRKENLERMMKGATGAPTATGSAARAAGPSDSYAGRIRARVRPNITFTDDVSGNPMAAVEVRLAPDGTITSRHLIKSSGVKSWDEAVLRALDKTEILPKDVDGRVHSPLTIEFKPKG